MIKYINLKSYPLNESVNHLFIIIPIGIKNHQKIP